MKRLFPFGAAFTPEPWPREQPACHQWLVDLATVTGSHDAGLYQSQHGVMLLRIVLPDKAVLIQRADYWHLIGSLVYTVPYMETRQ